MLHREIGLQKVATSFIVLGVVILTGVLSMAFGYYGGNDTALYAGVSVVVLGSFNTAILVAIRPLQHRRFRH